MVLLSLESGPGTPWRTVDTHQRGQAGHSIEAHSSLGPSQILATYGSYRKGSTKWGEKGSVSVRKEARTIQNDMSQHSPWPENSLY